MIVYLDSGLYLLPHMEYYSKLYCVLIYKVFAQSCA